MDLEIIVWILAAFIITQGGLSLWFVRWVLWRNQQLTDLISWKHLNGKKLDILASRFKISVPKCDWCQSEDHKTADCTKKEFNISQINLEPVKLVLEDD